MGYYLGQVWGFVLSVFFDCSDQGRVVGFIINEHGILKISLDTLPHIGRCLSEEAQDLVKQGLVVTYVFVYVFEVGEFFGGGLIDMAGDIHWIDILEAFL